MIKQNGEIALTDLAKGILPSDQPRRVKTCIGADAAGRTLLAGGVEIRRDQADRPIAPHLQRQLPSQLDGLPDHRGQKHGLGHHRFDLGGVIMLGQDPLKRLVKARDAAPDIASVQLERQDGVVPRDLCRQCHGWLS